MFGVDLNVLKHSDEVTQTPSGPPRFIRCYKLIGRKWRHSEEVASSVPSPNSTCHNTTAQQRRELLHKCLSNYNQERLKRKIATVPPYWYATSRLCQRRTRDWKEACSSVGQDGKTVQWQYDHVV